MNDRMKTHGDFGWVDMMTDDVEGAVKFYTEVIGWDTEVMDMGMGPYTVVKAGGQGVGGIMGKPPEAAGQPNGWNAYVTVDDVDKRAAQVSAAGGKVLNGPMDIPQVGRMAMIQDPTGGVLGIMTYFVDD